MSLIVPNTAEVLMLKYLLNVLTTSGDPTDTDGNRLLRLYKTDVGDPPPETTASLTEATQSGYAPITLVGATWSVGTDAGVTTGSYSEQTFTFNTSATIYGYYVTTMTGQLLWVERFSTGPFQLPDGGGQIAIVPTVTLD